MAREIQERTLLKLDEKKRSGRNGKEDKTMLRVVQWNDYRPTLEKREFWKDGSQWKSGKCKGLNIDDFHLIADNWEEIMDILEGADVEEVEEEEERPRGRSSNIRSSGKSSKRSSKKKSKTRGKRRSVLTHNDDDGDDDNYNSEDDDDFDDYDD